MRTVILGAAGQLGRELRRILPGDVVPLTRADADLTNLAQLRQTLAQLRPGAVINAAAYTDVDRAEAEPAEAFAVNALALRELAASCRAADCTLIHISTNYVFGLDAPRTSPYDETDAPGPINVYGVSKLAGEHFVRSICPKHFILRTCGLYAAPATGGGRTNFIEALLRKASEGTPLRVVDDQICTPTAAADLARAVSELLPSQAFGLYHVTNAGACTWHEFAAAILDFTGATVALTPIKSDAYAAPAKRPAFSVLSNAKWIDHGFTPLPSWRDALKRYLAGRAS